jgi:hypothetical protein
MSRALDGTGDEPVGITDAFVVAGPEARIATAADRWRALGKTPPDARAPFDGPGPALRVQVPRSGLVQLFLCDPSSHHLQMTLLE